MNSSDVEVIPSSWVTDYIKNTNEYKSGSITPSKYPEETFELFSVPIFPSGRAEIIKGSEIGSSKQIVEEGDVLLCKINPRINRVWVVTKNQGYRQIASSEWIVIRNSEHNSSFLKYYFSEGKFRELLCSDVSGVGGSLTRAKPSLVAEYKTPIAPLEEQTRIVEKLDSLLAQVETIQQRLNNLPDIIKRFRQSVLAAAVSGKLTEQWRRLHTKEAWKNLTIGEVTTFQNGFAFKSGCFSESGPFQIIKLANVKDDNLKLDAAPAFVDEKVAQEFIRYKPEIDDLLISMTGTKYKGDYGYVCRVPLSQKILINQRVGRIIPDKEKVCSKYLLQFMRSELFRVEFFKGETGGVNQGNVGTKHIKSCPIKVPPIEEQTEIVRLVEQYFALADTLEKHLANAKARVENLTQSILAKAFRGELVPQDPNDEPADKLLERIKAARLEAEKLEKAAKKAAKVKR